MSSFVTIPQPVGKDSQHKNGESSAFKYNSSFHCFLTGESILQKTILQWVVSIIFLLFALQQNIEISSKTRAWLSNTTSNVCRLIWWATYGGTRTKHRGEVSYWRSEINWNGPFPTAFNCTTWHQCSSFWWSIQIFYPYASFSLKTLYFYIWKWFCMKISSIDSLSFDRTEMELRALLLCSFKQCTIPGVHSSFPSSQ